jgi:hypothetical protein
MDVKPLTMSVAPSTVEVHIEELVLHGFPGGDRFSIADAVQREVARLVAEGGIPGLVANPENVDRLDAGTFKVAPDARPQEIGSQVAHSLHSRLSTGIKAPHPRRKGTGKR